MVKPRVFISAFHYDVHEQKFFLKEFVEQFSYEAILSKKESIASDHKKTFDAGYIRTIAQADLFVFFIGGRYASAEDKSGIQQSSDFYDRCVTIAKKECQTAVKEEVPIYILVEKNVYQEYETFKRNRGNDHIIYAHVDSIYVFRALDEIIELSKNNKIFPYRKPQDIRIWLKTQWAEYFKELILQTKHQKKVSSVSQQVSDLMFITESVKRYSEILLQESTSANHAEQIIAKENQKIKWAKRLRDFAGIEYIHDLIYDLGLPENTVIQSFMDADSLDDLAKRLENQMDAKLSYSDLVEFYNSFSDNVESINQARKILGKDEIGFDLGKE